MSAVDWRCRGCGGANEPSSGSCLRCGEARRVRAHGSLVALVSSGRPPVRSAVNLTVVSYPGPGPARDDDEAPRRRRGSVMGGALRVTFILLGWAGILTFACFVAFLMILVWKAFHL